ncbi:MAG: phytanoyl-CoA dioxygenase family protein [Minwuiales bacterium]|nr:phytanoyl-CoA dioxygenase family protein [Minwuiales bacterium]
MSMSEAEIATYRRDGLVVPDYRLPDETLTRMRAALDRLIAANPNVSRDSMFCPHIRSGGVQGLGGTDEWLDFARLPAVLDMVEQLIGPDIVLWGTTLFGKPAGQGKEVPWHQDGEYWPIRPLATCSVWIALDDCDAENGCLRCVPGSHACRRLLRHRVTERDGIVLNQELEPGEFDEREARDVVLKAGQMSFHDVYMIHGSRPNRSDRRRAGYVLRFMPATSHFDRALGATLAARSGVVDFVKRPIWLLRGVDRSGLNDFNIGHQEQ